MALQARRWLPGRDVVLLGDSSFAVLDHGPTTSHALTSTPNHPMGAGHGVDPDRAAVIEHAIAGVAAGRTGRFRLVIGVDRGAGERALLRAGADVVVSDLPELAVGTTQP